MQDKKTVWKASGFVCRPEDHDFGNIYQCCKICRYPLDEFLRIARKVLMERGGARETAATLELPLWESMQKKVFHHVKRATILPGRKNYYESQGIILFAPGAAWYARSTVARVRECRLNELKDEECRMAGFMNWEYVLAAFGKQKLHRKRDEGGRYLLAMTGDSIVTYVEWGKDLTHYTVPIRHLP